MTPYQVHRILQGHVILRTGATNHLADQAVVAHSRVASGESTAEGATAMPPFVVLFWRAISTPARTISSRFKCVFNLFFDGDSPFKTTVFIRSMDIDGCSYFDDIDPKVFLGKGLQKSTWH